jgi:hypothetical protein
MKFTKDELIKFEADLKQNGYRRISTHLKTEDYGWWKSFGNEGGYQIAFLVYDFSKYPLNADNRPIGIQNEFILNDNPVISRVDMTIYDDRMTFEEFENFSYYFYKTINQYFKINII